MAARPGSVPYPGGPSGPGGAAPPGGRRLAGNGFCPNFMFGQGEHIVAIQGHPEFPVDYDRALIEKRQQHLAPERYQACLDSLEQEVARREWEVRGRLEGLGRTGGETEKEEAETPTPKAEPTETGPHPCSTDTDTRRET